MFKSIVISDMGRVEFVFFEKVQNYRQCEDGEMRYLFFTLQRLSCCLLLILLSAVGCSKQSAVSTPMGPVRLAYVPYSADLPFFVAMEKGFFKEHGLDIEPIQCKSSSEALDLVLAGKADGAMGNSFSVLFSIHARNSNVIRLVNVSMESADEDRFTGFALRGPESTIRSPKELRGKRLGTEKGASQLLWVKLYLKKLGIDPEKDVTIEQETPEVLLNALHAKQLDVVFAFEPYATVGLNKGFAKSLEPFFRKTILNPFPAGGASLSRDFCQREPATAKKVVQALDEAIEFIERRPEEAKLTLLRFTPLDKETAAKSQIYAWRGSLEISADLLQKLADIMANNGELVSRIDVTTMVR